MAPESKKTAEQETSAPAPGADQQARQTRPQVQVDDADAAAMYANFCRVTGTPEELILDFALNPQPFGVPTAPIKVSQRIVANFYTAKRMLHALQLTLQRHEAAFGVLETDVQKRVVGSARGAVQAPRTGEGGG